MTEFLLVIFTGLLALFTLLLWLATRKLWKAGEQQLKSVQATADAATQLIQLCSAVGNAARASADAASTSATAAREANALYLKAFAADQRAWILITELSPQSALTCEEGKLNLTVSYKLRNFGKTVHHMRSDV